MKLKSPGGSIFLIRLFKARLGAMVQQISDLKEDINSKLRQIAAVYAQDGYAKAVSSQSAYRDAVTKEVGQLQGLQSKLGLKPTPNPTYYPFYPYYYFLSL